MTTRHLRIGLAVVLVTMVAAGLLVTQRTYHQITRVDVTGYFANSNGVFVGDEVRILGIPVGEIERIEPEGERVKITFWYNDEYQVPADANAVILSPSLVPARAIQLTPAYTGGPVMGDDSVIPETRTAVPVEWDDLREQLKKLTAALEPTEPGGTSTLGALVNTAADNVRGEGANIRQTIIAMSQALSIFGDHSNDVFSTVDNLSILVSALQDSTAVIRQLNQNLASALGLLSNDPGEVGNAVRDVNAVVDDVRNFVADNRETMGVASERMASISGALVESLDDLEQTLHVAPNTVQNFANIYHPAQGSIHSAMVMNMFADPITFVCGGIQAASRLNAEQSAKLCVQYLAPIVKNRQINFPPLGVNPIVGAMARPNELTYSEDWLRPDYVPPQPAPGTPSAGTPPAADGVPLAAEATSGPPAATHQSGPANGLQDMLIPPGPGS